MIIQRRISRTLPCHGMRGPGQAAPEIVEGEVDRLGRGEVAGEHRAGVAQRAAPGVQPHVEGGDVGIADEDLAAVRHAVEIDVRHQPAHAVLAAQCDHDLHVGVGGGRVQLGQAGGVRTAEALVALVVLVVVVDQDALGFEVGDAARDGFGFGRKAARGDQRDAEPMN
jgi:hypothetical protein